jgi:phosphate transport system protein
MMPWMLLHVDAEQALKVLLADADIDREYQSATRTL